MTEGYLDSDHVLNCKVAEFLNSTGLTIHTEIIFSLVIFRYVIWLKNSCGPALLEQATKPLVTVNGGSLGCRCSRAGGE